MSITKDIQDKWFAVIEERKLALEAQGIKVNDISMIMTSEERRQFSQEFADAVAKEWLS